MAPILIRLGEYIKQEGLHIIIQRFVIQEHLGQQAQILAVNLVLSSIHFKDRHNAVSVNLVARRVLHGAFDLVCSYL